ncbi:MAG TPA: type II toxin-antitoxin system RelE/ParE family toxin [Thermoplasmata archaeon]|nr:type II toxin-antitoxin system RelE/ParE family toxin [Thermoplasmata archaeon]
MVWSETAARDLSGLDLPVARRVVRKLEEAATDPERYFERLVATEDSKLRIGDYRLLALLDRSTRTILIERVDHRSRVYR